MSSREAIKTAIGQYTSGNWTFDELRSFLLTHVSKEQCESLFSDLTPTTGVQLIEWITLNRRNLSHSRPSIVLLGKRPADQDSQVSRFLANGRAVARHISKTTSWTTSLNLDLAVSNVRSDTFGDWYRDPWTWPEIEWLAKEGRTFVLERQLRAQKTHSWRLDVPKSNGSTRAATVLEPVERVLYQACVDNLAPAINERLPEWVFGWRLIPGHNTVSRYARQDYQWDNFVQRIRRAHKKRSRALFVDIENFFGSISEKLLSDSVRELGGGEAGERALQIALANGVESGGGLPQRSSASSVLANLVLSNVGGPWGTSSTTFSRWMDDTWIFARRTDTLERVQREMEQALADAGLRPNASKTRILEGAELDQRLDDLGVDLTGSYGAISPDLTSSERPAWPYKFNTPDQLASAFDHLIGHKSGNSRELRYLLGRIKRENRKDLAIRLADNLDRLSGHARLVASVLKRFELWPVMMNWYEQFIGSDALPLVKLHYLEMFPVSATMPRSVVSMLSDVAQSKEQPDMLRAGALSRLAVWGPNALREIFDTQRTLEFNPLLRRAFGMSGLAAGIDRRALRRFLMEDDATHVILGFLTSIGFEPRFAPIL